MINPPQFSILIPVLNITKMVRAASISARQSNLDREDTALTSQRAPSLLFQRDRHDRI
jgi:hypothetical protein